MAVHLGVAGNVLDGVLFHAVLLPEMSCMRSGAESSQILRIFLPTSDMIRSRKMLKRVGDRRHSCLTPTVVLNHSPMLPFIWTALVALSAQWCELDLH